MSATETKIIATLATFGLNIGFPHETTITVTHEVEGISSRDVFVVREGGEVVRGGRHLNAAKAMAHGLETCGWLHSVKDAEL